jgi:hypothetical protein
VEECTLGLDEPVDPLLPELANRAPDDNGQWSETFVKADLTKRAARCP